MKMQQLYCSIILLIALSVPVAAQPSLSDDGTGLMKSATIGDVRMSLAPFFTSATLVGETSDMIRDLGGDAWDKLVLGGGLSLTYHPRTEYSFGILVERFYKSIPADVDAIRGWVVAGHFELYAAKYVKAVPYGRADLGFATGIFPGFLNGDDLDLGTHLYARLGIGMVSLFPRNFHLKIEIFYAQAFTNKHELEQLGDSELSRLRFQTKRVGLEVAVGFPLMSR